MHNDSSPLAIWKAIKAAGRPVNESEIRKATNLGVGTVNRWVRTLAKDGYIKPAADGRTEARSYLPSDDATSHAVGSEYTPRPGPKKEAKVTKRRKYGPGLTCQSDRTFTYNGEGIGRVSSVFQLAAGCM